MISRRQLTIVLGLAAVAFGIVLHLHAVPVKVVWLEYVSTVVGVVAVPLAAFEWWLWRITPNAFGSRPCLYGTWRCVLQSSWKDPVTNAVAAPIDAFVTIYQTYSTLKLRLFTAESSSKTTSASITKDEDSVFVLEANYLNEPSPKHQERSRMHYGSMRLHLERGDEPALQGTYWTDRGTFGEMRLTGRNKKKVDGFERAKSLLADAAAKKPAKS